FSRTMDAGIRSSVMHACATVGFMPRYAHKTTSIPMLISMIAAGVGISLLSNSAARIPRAGVAYAPIRDASASTVLAAGILRDRATPLAAIFVEAAREAAAALEA